MTSGELLTKLTVRAALCAYGIGTSMMLAQRHPGAAWKAGVRWVWTVGCAFFLAHVVCAFQFYHHWSHTAAYLETAARTERLTGRSSGAGIYLNYLFAALWVGETLWQWLSPRARERRPAWVGGLLHGFFLFMIFNGTIVFGSGPARWLGSLICLGLAALWVRRRVSGIAPARPMK